MTFDPSADETIVPSDARAPCEGVVVVELTTMVSGPMAGQILADYGADVIRLEGLNPEMMRLIPPVREGLSASFAQFNRNKRSIAIDLKSEKGRHIAWTLIERADVLIENYRAGVADKIGFGYDAVRRRNAKLIYVSINGFGSSGPYADQPAYDMAIQGLVGFMPIQGSPEEPRAIRSTIVDKVTAMAAATATLAALLQRTVDGQGQHIEVPMLDVWAGVILPELMAPGAFVDDPEPAAKPADVYRPIRTRDGHIIGLVAQDKQFAAICGVLGCERLLTDPRYATAAQRFAQMDAIIDELETRSSEFSSEKLLEQLRATGDVVIAPVNSLVDFYADPQVMHNQTVYDVEHGSAGRLRQIKPMANLHGSAAPRKQAAPLHGEHTVQIMNNLGFDNVFIDDCQRDRVI